MFRRIVFSACLAGLVAGLLLTGVQLFQVTPLILEAETYENAAAPITNQGDLESHDGHSHDGPWSPHDGAERALWTAVANIGMAIGFGLLLVAAYALRDNVTITQGLIWGLAGYATFYLNPALGLTPELPGMEASALELRQAWWIATVVLTALGLALALLTKHWALRVAGVGLLFVPHLIGAPHTISSAQSGPPAELLQAFFIATAIANAVFWLALGAGTAFAYRKLA